MFNLIKPTKSFKRLINKSFQNRIEKSPKRKNSNPVKSSDSCNGFIDFSEKSIFSLYIVYTFQLISFLLKRIDVNSFQKIVVVIGFFVRIYVFMFRQGFFSFRLCITLISSQLFRHKTCFIVVFWGVIQCDVYSIVSKADFSQRNLSLLEKLLHEFSFFNLRTFLSQGWIALKR